MSGKSFSFDLGRVMDEAFRVAQSLGEAFEKGMSEGFDHAEEFREKFRDQFRWSQYTDFYPYYSYPPANIYLTADKTLVFEFALAGFEEKEVELQFRGDHLYLSARSPASEQPEEGVQYFKKRLKLRDIPEQRYYVPEDKFDRGKVEARFKNGLLKVVVPPREELKAKPGVKVKIVAEKGGEGGAAGGKPKS